MQARKGLAQKSGLAIVTLGAGMQGDGHASLDVDSESVDELPSLSPPAGGKN